jgi:hypothetical protein
MLGLYLLVGGASGLTLGSVMFFSWAYFGEDPKVSGCRLSFVECTDIVGNRLHQNNLAVLSTAFRTWSSMLGVEDRIARDGKREQMQNKSSHEELCRYFMYNAVLCVCFQSQKKTTVLAKLARRDRRWRCVCDRRHWRQLSSGHRRRRTATNKHAKRQTRKKKRTKPNSHEERATRQKKKTLMH